MDLDFYQTAYFSAGLFYFAIWLALFFLRKDVHKQMLVVGLFLIGTAPINIIWHWDYWHPPYIFGNIFPFEDFFWGFAFAGVVAVAYEVIFRIRLKMSYRHCVKEIARELCILLGIIVSTLLVLSNIFHLNSIYAISVGLILVVWYMHTKRPDLMRDMFWSGIFSVVFVFIFYVVWQYPYPGVFERFWNMDAISGILILGIPLEELVWFFLAGMFVGPLYEFVTGAKVEKIKNCG